MLSWVNCSWEIQRLTIIINALWSTAPERNTDHYKWIVLLRDTKVDTSQWPYPFNENCTWQRDRMVLHNANFTLLRYTNHIWTMSTYIYLYSGWADVIFLTIPKDIRLIVSDLYSSDKTYRYTLPNQLFWYGGYSGEWNDPSFGLQRWYQLYPVIRTQKTCRELEERR